MNFTMHKASKQTTVTLVYFTINFRIIYKDAIHGIITYGVCVGRLAMYNTSMPSWYDYILFKIVWAQFVMAIITERKTPPNECHRMPNAVHNQHPLTVNTISLQQQKWKMRMPWLVIVHSIYDTDPHQSGDKCLLTVRHTHYSTVTYTNTMWTDKTSHRQHMLHDQ